MINVMIADDDHNARTGLVDMIDWDSLDARVVAVVEDGEQAIDILKSTPNIDLIILDICMPYVDGLSVARYMRERELETEIILLSAHAEFEYAREALKYGIREYIIKPVNRAKLVQLADAIKEVSRRKENDIKWRNLVHGTEFKKALQSAVQQKNIQQFKKILDIEKDFPDISTKKYKEYYLVVLSLMREFCRNRENSSLDEKCFEQFHEISDITVMRDFLISTFSNLVDNGKYDTAKQSSGNIVILVKQYIQANVFSPDIHSSTVAAHFNLSVDHISRLFKSAGDTSLSDYIINTKIDKAKEFIENTDHSIRQIAQMIGYFDPNYFVRVFKKRTGVTPTEYRTMKKEAPG